MLRYSCIFLFLIYFGVLCAKQLSKRIVWDTFTAANLLVVKCFEGINPGFRLWGMRKLFFSSTITSTLTGCSPAEHRNFLTRPKKRHCCHVTLKHSRSSLQKFDKGFTWAHGQTGCCLLYCVKTQSKHSFTLESQDKLWTRSTENALLCGRLSEKSVGKIDTLVFIVLTAMHCDASWFATLTQELKVPSEWWRTCRARGEVKGQSCGWY